MEVGRRPRRRAASPTASARASTTSTRRACRRSTRCRRSSSARSPRSPRRVWVNPDCGLKTRGYDETVASLEHIVEATRAVRAELAEPVLAE